MQKIDEETALYSLRTDLQTIMYQVDCKDNPKLKRIQDLSYQLMFLIDDYLYP